MPSFQFDLGEFWSDNFVLLHQKKLFFLFLIPFKFDLNTLTLSGKSCSDWAENSALLPLFI
jgi:hypothetical protein